MWDNRCTQRYATIDCFAERDASSE
jgi:hypothetical protein